MIKDNRVMLAKPMSGPTLQNLPSGPGKSGQSFIKMQINLISLEISEMMRKCFKVHVFAIQVLALVKLGRYVQSKNSYDSFSFHFALLLRTTTLRSVL